VKLVNILETKRNEYLKAKIDELKKAIRLKYQRLL
jgi:hypothetical protein